MTRRQPWAGSTRRSRLPSDWASVQRAVLRRDQHQCQLRLAGCDGRATQADHIVAGDDHRMSNLQAVCGPCHSKKSSSEGGHAAAAVRATARRPPERHPGLLP